MVFLDGFHIGAKTKRKLPAFKQKEKCISPSQNAFQGDKWVVGVSPAHVSFQLGVYYNKDSAF